MRELVTTSLLHYCCAMFERNFVVESFVAFVAHTYNTFNMKVVHIHVILGLKWF